MNISPSKYQSMVEELDRLKTQVAAIFGMLASSHNQDRDPSISGFCRRNGICRASYFNMRDRGEGPTETRVGPKRIIITEQHEDEWRRKRQEVAAQMLARRTGLLTAAE
jgi:hypothetical protein